MKCSWRVGKGRGGVRGDGGLMYMEMNVLWEGGLGNL